MILKKITFSLPPPLTKRSLLDPKLGISTPFSHPLHVYSHTVSSWQEIDQFRYVNPFTAKGSPFDQQNRLALGRVKPIKSPLAVKGFALGSERVKI